MASSKEFSSRNRESQSRSPEERRPSDTPTPNFILPPSFVVNRPPVSQGSSSAPKPVTQPNFSVPPPPLIPMRIGGIRSSFPPVATTTAPVIQNRQPVPQGATSSKAPLASAPPPNMTRPPPTTSLPNFMLPPPVVAQPNPVSNTPRVVSIPPPGLVKPLLGSNSTTGPPGILKPTNAPCPVPPLVFSNISKLPTTMNNPLASTSMEEKGEEAMDVDDDDEEEDGASSSGGNVDRVEKNGNSVSEEAPLVDETIQKASYSLNEIRDSEVMQKFFQLRAEGDRKRIERELNEAAKKDTDLRTLGTSSNGSNGTQTTRSLSNILDSISNYEDDDDEKSKKPETLSDSDYRTHVLPRNDASQMNFPLDRDDRFLNQARTSVMNRTNGLNGLTEQGAKSSGSFNHLFPNIASFQNGTLGMIAASAANPVAQPAPNPASVPATVPVARPAPNPASVPATVPVARPAPTPAPIPAPRPIRSPNSSPPRADVVGFKPQSFLDQVTQRKASCSTGIEQNQQQISNNNTPSSSSETQASPKKFPKKPKDYDSVDPSTSDARLQESWNKSITSETKSQVAPAKVPVDDDDDDDIIIIEDGEIHEPKNANKKVVAGSDAPPGITARSNPAFRGGRGRSNSRGGFFQNSSQPRTVWMDFLKPISDPSADNYTILIDPMMKEPDMRAAELRELFRKLHKLKTSVPPSSPRIHPTVFLHHSQYELMMNKHHQNSPMTNYFHVFHEFSNSSPPVVEVLPHHTPCDGFCIQIAELQACLSKIHQHRKSTEAIFLTHQYEENQVTVKCMIDNNIKVMSIRGLERFIETRLGEPLN
uniref:Tyrosine-protein phosphatase domain-containing protein n=1 Tax=Caenorhabditis tropicalis TaxID=1561998 RepID=A0A1I7UNA7_9PELO